MREEREQQMSYRSQQHAPLIPVEMKVCQTTEEIPRAELISNSATAEAKVDDCCCLSGDKPFFSVILAKSHAEYPYRLSIPAYLVPVLPRVSVPMVLTHGGKEWNMSYIGNMKRPRIESSDWREFVHDNNLECDDACIFEVMESSNEIIRLRVIIFRKTNELPPELAALVASRGNTPETALEID